MTVAKIAVSIPERLLHRARAAVARGRAASVSAYVASALEQKSKLDELEQLLEQMLAETGGPMTAAERRQADRILATGKARKRTAA
ncbi:MAG: toxin-antitoxin system antitoxin subunit [Myxococcales bacterium]|nr:toxin-antitoxin system antitoxin subunit [Myxococcales bacterium]